MQSKLFISLIATILAFSNLSLAQSSSDTATWKAVYIDVGGIFRPMGTTLGATLVTHNNWFVACRLENMDFDASQRPDDFKVPSTQYTYTAPPGGNSGNGGGWIDLDLSGLNNLYGGSGSGGGIKEGGIEIIKHVRLLCFSAGWLYQLPNPKFRIRTEAGVALMKINEPVDFVFVPKSVEEIDEYITLTHNEGYTFTASERKDTGLLVRTGIELPLTKVIGLNTSFSAAVAKSEKIYGFSVGLMIGLLR